MSESTETVEEIMARWNPPTKIDGIEQRAGGIVPEGDGRATASSDPEADSASSKVDTSLPAGVKSLTPVADDEDEDGEDASYDDMSKAELKDEIDARNADRDEDEHLSKAGNKQDLVDRLVADDEASAE